MIYESVFDSDGTERRVMPALMQLVGVAARDDILRAFESLGCVIWKKPEPEPEDDFEVIELAPALRCVWCTKVATHIVAGNTCCIQCLNHAKQFARTRQ